MAKKKKIKRLESEIVELNRTIDILCSNDKTQIALIKTGRLMRKTIEGELFKGNSELYHMVGIMGVI